LAGEHSSETDDKKPTRFDAREDVAYRLWQLVGSPTPIRLTSRVPHLPGEFNAEVGVVLRCEVLGIEKEFEETRTVKVDVVNRQIKGAVKMMLEIDDSNRKREERTNAFRQFLALPSKRPLRFRRWI